MVGIDLTKISRFYNLEEKFCQSFLSENEFQEYISIKDYDLKAKFLAVHWALKEAVYKCDNTFNNFSLIEIQKENGRYIFKDFSLSTSDENDLLIAIAIKN
ncbi:UNVERIFIED_CONTAM: 4'-phosphopantetheinyl transferase superfamily protein [Campylobacter lari]